MNRLTRVKKQAESEPTIIIVKADIHEICATFLYFRNYVFRMHAKLSIERSRQITLRE